MAMEATMSDYERRRLENIKRNGEMMASLSIHSHLSDLSSLSKRLRRENVRKYQKRPKVAEGSVVIRRSFRTQGIPPHFDGLPHHYNESLVPSINTPNVGPVSMSDVYKGECSYQKLVHKFTCHTENDTPLGTSQIQRIKAEKNIDCKSFKLEPQNVARVLSENILAVRFLPSSDLDIVVVGNRKGELGFWDVSQRSEVGDGIYVYQPHHAAISGISVHPFSLSKVYTSSYEGLIRSMNIEREEFDLVYSSSSGSALYSISQQPNDANSIYVSEGLGVLNIYDERGRKIVNSWSLHEERINCIDINSANSFIIATSSSDGLACLWDLRKMDVKHGHCKALQTVDLGRTVLSAYFSPSGSCLAMSSVGCSINVLSGANFEDLYKFRDSSHKEHIHKNRWSTSPRAVWGWDDEHLFASEMKRRIKILSVNRRIAIHTLESFHMSNISHQYDAHPCKVGMLAAATNGGYVYIWTSSL
ncbi:uncharacterized protein LOC130803496 [Amaranthus tricolor]|uniref:uncharacterized protein LOC130803496 n=1 Tax=Amaranthus tricolor TaxID=29722 RepID=UPI0025840042|nr:uncharacterized protein LOC130803496 [Amaranthus tricolor]